MPSRTKRHLAVSALAVCAAGVALQASRQLDDISTEELSLVTRRRVCTSPVSPGPEAEALADNGESDPFAREVGMPSLHLSLPRQRRSHP